VREARARLEDILDAIENIEKYADRGSVEFYANELIQSWCAHQIQVIGEALDHLRDQHPEWLLSYPHIPWDEFVSMRHKLVHGYFEIRTDVVWDTVANDIPQLKKAILELLEKSR
jgi:uncharacterized protein with HEPN domain